MKILTKHTIYEVLNEWTAESVFIDHKPTRRELIEILKLEKWFDAEFPITARFVEITVNDFIKYYITVEKLKKIYTKK